MEKNAMTQKEAIEEIRAILPRLQSIAEMAFTLGEDDTLTQRRRVIELVGTRAIDLIHSIAKLPSWYSFHKETARAVLPTQFGGRQKDERGGVIVAPCIFTFQPPSRAFAELDVDAGNPFTAEEIALDEVDPLCRPKPLDGRVTGGRRPR